MTDLLFSLLKINIVLGAIYLFYILFLNRLTFFQSIRYYFLIGTIMAISFSQANIESLDFYSAMKDYTLVQSIPAIDLLLPDTEKSHQTKSDLYGTVLFRLWILITGLLFFRLIIRIYSLIKIKQSAKLLFSNPVKVYQVNQTIKPFSFGDSIFINKESLASQELQKIINHEIVHARECHSLDLIWAEMLCIVNWYNPFSWMIRNAMRQNLEYIADYKIVQSGIDRVEYQYLLLKISGHASSPLANHFNFSSLKNRMYMMNLSKSSPFQILRFILLIPMACILLLSFRKANLVSNNTSDKSMSALFLTDTVPTTQSNIKSININNNKAVVKHSDGTQEIFDLSTVQGKADFKKKYPPPPPPPPPPAPAAPAPPGHKSPRLAPPPPPPTPSSDFSSFNSLDIPVPLTIPVAPIAPVAPVAPVPPVAPVAPVAPIDLIVPVPPVAPPPPLDLPDHINSLSIENSQATIIYKNGKKESFNLKNATEKAAYRKAMQKE